MFGNSSVITGWNELVLPLISVQSVAKVVALSVTFHAAESISTKFRNAVTGLAKFAKPISLYAFRYALLDAIHFLPCHKREKIAPTKFPLRHTTPHFMSSLLGAPLANAGTALA